MTIEERMTFLVEQLERTKAALADLQQRHSTLIHMLNDVCCVANEFDPSTDCGARP